jgi:hypothetical protein
MNSSVGWLCGDSCYIFLHAKVYGTEWILEGLILHNCYGKSNELLVDGSHT